MQQAADERFAIIPDFIANCGMARLFAYLMHEGAAIEEGAMKEDVKRTVRDAMDRVLDGHPNGMGLLDRAFGEFLPG